MSALHAHRRTTGIGMTSARTRTRLIEYLREQGIRDERVLAAMNAVPRHIFVDEALAHRAYEDTALPIGHAQTISRPYTVARMLECLLQRRAGREAPLNKVLEIGTGCGYQAAVLAKLAREVYSVERIRALLDRARTNLLGLALANLRLAHGDGRLGLPDAAPFDAVILAAAAPDVPRALVEQLAPGGTLLLPLRSAHTQDQRLLCVVRGPGGVIECELDPVHFVPLRAGKV